ncbi:rhodanese-like domain-containing protein [Chromobacterium subtsugae]|uniref:Rhodanese-like domain-containing protein n=1 Tax=Chromobacterium subtsugae TaxID=251747 RepID=A0ABS7FFY1_9NEIS|nr:MULTISPECIES: rhodanese-like domain-containing protein [Chromobacterium]KUM02403.1 rhodanese [Chromobacterium subtsugae]KZE86846.1 rhodanese [Chromobacterium sp. F49]MBW7566904.1 rhodanese-like domain-containing protein [Chromobacterium subtsugae]MBW8288208.1 rhodanese-like domain-containing protein [Chromobacterium subtsugae]OBU86613.1 rhodanese [Chromobacterium subtsugae]
MSKVKQILQTAHQRAERSGLPYSGALLPDEAYELLQSLPKTVLLDVRSHAEWQFVGTVPGAVNIEWKSYPGMAANPNFLAQLTHQVDPEAVLLVMCRSGARSDQVARLAAANGYSEVYNVLEGFEGDLDASGHRNSVGGWRQRGLPWMQG